MNVLAPEALYFNLHDHSRSRPSDQSQYIFGESSHQQIADLIDADFAHIAYHVPAYVKLGAVGTQYILCDQDNASQLRGMYIGGLRVRIEAEFFDENVGFRKAYELTFHRDMPGGAATIDLRPTTEQDLARMPLRPAVLAQMIHELRNEFDHVHVTQDFDNTVALNVPFSTQQSLEHAS